jgi:hypothetical protein
MDIHDPDLFWILDLYPCAVHGHVHQVSIEFANVPSSDCTQRLHLLRPSPKVLLVCRIILIAEWVFITTPNAILSAGATVSKNPNFAKAYSTTQRIEPAFYEAISIMLSCLYIYHAYIMFQRYGDEKIRLLLIRLLYTNLFLISLGLGNVILEYLGKAALEASYVTFLYSFVCSLRIKLESVANAVYSN